MPKDMEVDIPSSTIGERNQEVEQTLQDAREFMGAPKIGSRQRKQLDKYNGYMTLLNQWVDSDPSNYYEAAQKQVW